MDPILWMSSRTKKMQTHSKSLFLSFKRTQKMTTAFSRMHQPNNVYHRVCPRPSMRWSTYSGYSPVTFLRLMFRLRLLPNILYIYIHPPETLNSASDTLLQVNRLSNGILETGLYWYLTYHNHRKNTFSIFTSIHDPCFLYIESAMHEDQLESAAVGRFLCCRLMILLAQETTCS